MLVTLPSPIPEFQYAPLPLLKVLRARERALTPCSFIVFNLDSHLRPLRSLGVHHAMYVWFWRSFGRLDFTPNWKSVKFHQFVLSCIISKNGITMDPRKVQTIIDWAILVFVQDIQCFLGFTNFYECFIAHYSSIMAFLIQLTKKDQLFS